MNTPLRRPEESAGYEAPASPRLRGDEYPALFAVSAPAIHLLHPKYVQRKRGTEGLLRAGIQKSPSYTQLSAVS